MLSTDSSQAYGGMPVAPPNLFRTPSSCAADLALIAKPGSSRRGGTDSKLRVGNFITFSGAPGIWGPISANSVMLAVAEINKRPGRPIRLGLGPGRYRITLKRSDTLYRASITLTAGRAQPHRPLTTCPSRCGSH